MAQKNEILPDRQGPVGADKREVPPEHRERWYKFAFDVVVAALLALVAAVLVDRAQHTTQGDAKPSLERSEASTRAEANAKTQFGDETPGLRRRHSFLPRQCEEKEGCPHASKASRVKPGHFCRRIDRKAP